MTRLLERTDPFKEGLEPKYIINMLDRLRKEKIDVTGFMLLRHGKVLCEAYWEPYGADKLRTVYSLSKTFTSMAAGIAIQEGRLSLDEHICDIFRDKIEKEDIKPGPELKALKVSDLLKMSTGQPKEPFDRENAWKDLSAALMKEPFSEMPGNVFRYNTAATYMVSAILASKGIDLEKYLQEKLFDPMGISGTRWLRDAGGVCTGGFGFSLYPEVIAKLGQLLLQKGNWDGKQLVSEKYISAASSKQISNGSDTDSDWAQGYGYQMWMCRYGAFRGDGMYGQLCVVHPETQTVLAMNCITADMQGELNAYFDEVLKNYSDGPLEPDEKELERLRNRLTGLKYERDVPEDDKGEFPEKLNGITIGAEDYMVCTLEYKDEKLLIRTKEGMLLYSAGRGKWEAVERPVYCAPFYMEDKRNTIGMAVWAMQKDEVVIKIFEPEFLEENAIYLKMPESGKLKVKILNTTIPSSPQTYVDTEVQI